LSVRFWPSRPRCSAVHDRQKRPPRNPRTRTGCCTKSVSSRNWRARAPTSLVTGWCRRRADTVAADLPPAGRGRRLGAASRVGRPRLRKRSR